MGICIWFLCKGKHSRPPLQLLGADFEKSNLGQKYGIYNRPDLKSNLELTLIFLQLKRLKTYFSTNGHLYLVFV